MPSCLKLRELAEIINFADDSRVSLSYITDPLVKQLGLKKVKRLRVRREMLMQALERSKTQPAWFNPITREMVLSDCWEKIDTAVEETFPKPTKDLMKVAKWKLKRLLSLTEVNHELKHDERTLTEKHYYLPIKLDLLNHCLLYLQSEITQRDFLEGISASNSFIAGSSFPQECSAIRTSDKLLKTVNPEFEGVAETAEEKFKLYEEAGSVKSVRKRCMKCTYLLPFMLEKKQEGWNIPIKKLDFNIADFGIPPAQPNTIWLAAATTRRQDLEEFRDHYSLLLEKMFVIDQDVKKEVKEQEKNFQRLHKPTIISHDLLIEIDRAKPRVMQKHQIFNNWLIHVSSREKSYYTPISLDHGLRKVLSGCYIVWVIGGDRWLCLTKEATNQDGRLVKLAIALYEIFDTLCTPLLYSMPFIPGCVGSRKCPVLKAITEGTPRLLLRYLVGVRRELRILKQVDFWKTELLPEFDWLFDDLSQLRKKCRKAPLNPQGKDAQWVN